MLNRGIGDGIGGGNEDAGMTDPLGAKDVDKNIWLCESQDRIGSRVSLTRDYHPLIDQSHQTYIDINVDIRGMSIVVFGDRYIDAVDYSIEKRTCELLKRWFRGCSTGSLIICFHCACRIRRCNTASTSCKASGHLPRDPTSNSAQPCSAFLQPIYGTSITRLIFIY